MKFRSLCLFTLVLAVTIPLAAQQGDYVCLNDTQCSSLHIGKGRYEIEEQFLSFGTWYTHKSSGDYSIGGDTLYADEDLYPGYCGLATLGRDMRDAYLLRGDTLVYAGWMEELLPENKRKRFVHSAHPERVVEEYIAAWYAARPSIGEFVSPDGSVKLTLQKQGIYVMNEPETGRVLPHHEGEWYQWGDTILLAEFPPGTQEAQAGFRVSPEDIEAGRIFLLKDDTLLLLELYGEREGFIPYELKRSSGR